MEIEENSSLIQEALLDLMLSIRPKLEQELEEKEDIVRKEVRRRTNTTHTSTKRKLVSLQSYQMPSTSVINFSSTNPGPNNPSSITESRIVSPQRSLPIV